MNQNTSRRQVLEGLVASAIVIGFDSCSLPTMRLRQYNEAQRGKSKVRFVVRESRYPVRK